MSNSSNSRDKDRNAAKQTTEKRTSPGSAKNQKHGDSGRFNASRTGSGSRNDRQDRQGRRG